MMKVRVGDSGLSYACPICRSRMNLNALHMLALLKGWDGTTSSF